MGASTGDYNLNTKYRNRQKSMCLKDTSLKRSTLTIIQKKTIKFLRVFEAAREQETSNRLSQVVSFQITNHPHPTSSSLS